MALDRKEEVRPKLTPSTSRLTDLKIEITSDTFTTAAGLEVLTAFLKTANETEFARFISEHAENTSFKQNITHDIKQILLEKAPETLWKICPPPKEIDEREWKLLHTAEEKTATLLTTFLKGGTPDRLSQHEKEIKEDLVKAKSIREQAEKELRAYYAIDNEIRQLQTDCDVIAHINDNIFTRLLNEMDLNRLKNLSEVNLIPSTNVLSKTKPLQNALSMLNLLEAGEYDKEYDKDYAREYIKNYIEFLLKKNFFTTDELKKIRGELSDKASTVLDFNNTVESSIYRMIRQIHKLSPITVPAHEEKNSTIEKTFHNLVLEKKALATNVKLFATDTGYRPFEPPSKQGELTPFKFEALPIPENLDWPDSSKDKDESAKEDSLDDAWDDAPDSPLPKKGEKSPLSSSPRFFSSSGPAVSIVTPPQDTTVEVAKKTMSKNAGS